MTPLPPRVTLSPFLPFFFIAGLPLFLFFFCLRLDPSEQRQKRSRMGDVCDPGREHLVTNSNTWLGALVNKHQTGPRARQREGDKREIVGQKTISQKARNSFGPCVQFGYCLTQSFQNKAGSKGIKFVVIQSELNWCYYFSEIDIYFPFVNTDVWWCIALVFPN